MPVRLTPGMHRGIFFFFWGGVGGRPDQLEWTMSDLTKTIVVMETDASTTGWGATCEGVRTGGPWSEAKSHLHTNCLYKFQQQHWLSNALPETKRTLSFFQEWTTPLQ